MEFIGEAKSLATGSFFENLLPDYIKRREADIVEIESALNSGDLKKIEHICHMVRGNATTFGFPGLTDMCREIESAARSLDKQRIRDLLSSMRNLSLWSIPAVSN